MGGRGSRGGREGEQRWEGGGAEVGGRGSRGVSESMQIRNNADAETPHLGTPHLGTPNDLRTEGITKYNFDII